MKIQNLIKMRLKARPNSRAIVLFNIDKLEKYDFICYNTINN